VNDFFVGLQNVFVFRC